MTPRFPIAFRAAAGLAALLAGAPAHAQSAGADEPPPALTASERLALQEAVRAERLAAGEAPPEPLPPPPQEDDPYAPLGVRVGAFTVFPSVEARVGHSDNVGADAVDPQSGSYSRIIPAIEVRSDWIRHEFWGRAVASFLSYFDGEWDDERSVEAEVGGRIDVRSDITVDLRGSYFSSPESRGDPNVPDAVLDAPEARRFGGEGILARQFGRTRISLRGAMFRNEYEDAPLADGTTLDNGDRTYDTVSGGVRASHDLGGGVALFAETNVNRRRYDRAIDRSGVERGSRGFDVLAGLQFAIADLFTGEIGAGYQRQEPDDPGLSDIEGAIVRGELAWRPSALTTVTVTGSILPEESVLEATAAGARVYSTDVELAHAFRRNLIATGRLGWSQADFVGSERENRWFEAGLGVEYRMSRELAFLIEATHERFEFTVPGDDYEDNRIEVGVRLSR